MRKLAGVTETDIILQIETSPMKWKVERTWKDMIVLRSVLVLQHPDTIVPWLPSTNKIAKMNDIKKLHFMRHSTMFFTRCFESKTLRSNQFLMNFLQDDVDSFKGRKNDIQQ